MTLTKRLYRIDEVRSALLYSIKTHRVDEALFWLNELEESCYGRETRRLLCIAWLMFVGLTRISLLSLWSTDALSVEGRRKICALLAKCRQNDSSIWWLICTLPIANDYVNGSSSVFDTWRSSWYKSEEDFWQPLMDWVEDERVEKIFESLQDDMGKYTVFARSIACVVRVYYKTIQKSSWEPFTLDTISNVNLTGNIKKDRLYSIPYDCLFGMTWRGMGVDTIDELRNISSQEFKKSPYWRTHVVDIDNDDNSKEEFYDTHFDWISCDIPDEWSLKEQQKSHGPGVSHPSAPLTRWWRNWVVSKSIFVWGKLETSVLEWINTEPGNTGISILDRIIQFYKEMQEKDKINQTYSLQPVKYKKEFILAI